MSREQYAEISKNCSRYPVSCTTSRSKLFQFLIDDCDFENGLCEFANGGLGGVGNEWSRVNAGENWDEFQAVLPGTDHTTSTKLGHYALADLRRANASSILLLTLTCLIKSISTYC